MYKLIFLTFLTTCAFADVPICPTDVYDYNTYPRFANDLTPFPANFSCILKINVGVGYALKILVSADYPENSHDSIIVITEHSLFTAENGVTTIYAPAPFANIFINTDNDQDKYFLRFDAFDVREYQKQPQKTGDYLRLHFPPKTMFTFSSPTDNVTLTAGSIINSDPTLAHTYVYLGKSLSMPYLGTLADHWVINTPLGPDVTIVNFHQDINHSWVIANDASSKLLREDLAGYLSAEIQNYKSYGLIVTGTKFMTYWSMKSFSDQSEAYTVICDDCFENYIDTFYFYSNQGYGPQIVEFHPLTPQDDMGAVLVYNDSSYNDNELPIQIPSFVFTIVLKKVAIGIQFNPSARDSWLIPYQNRHIIVTSPSLWRSIPAFDYTFGGSNQSGLFNFTILVESLFLGPADSMELSIGNSTNISFSDKLQCADNSTKCSLKDAQMYQGVGSYTRLKLNAGDNYSNAVTHIWAYGMNQTMISSSTTTSTLTYETATRSSNKLLIYFVILWSIFL